MTMEKFMPEFKLEIRFNSARSRRNFLVDILELIYKNDCELYKGDRRNYEDTVSFVVPDLAFPDNCRQLMHDEALIAIDPSHPAHVWKSVPNRQQNL
jgi:hypothetical protein